MKIIFLTIFIFVFSSARFASADEYVWSSSVPEDSINTSVGALALPLIKAETQEQYLVSQWNLNRSAIQKSLARMISQKSSIQALLSKKIGSFALKKSSFEKLTSDVGADAALVGEYNGSSIEFEIIAGNNGQPLTHFTVKVGNARDTEKIAQDIYIQLRSHIPYSGTITTTRGSKAQINLGSKEGLTPGSTLLAYDFTGNRPTFLSPQKKFAILKVLSVTAQSAVAKMLGTKSHIRPCLKLTILQIASPAPKPMITPTAPPPSMSSVFLPPQPIPQVNQIPPVIPKPQNFQSVSRHPIKTKPMRTKIEIQPRFVSTGMWAFAGVSFFALNTQISSASLAQRQFQTNLSPALELGFGYSRFNFRAMLSQLSNSSNSVIFAQLDSSFQIYTKSGQSLDYMTFVGLYGSQYIVTPAQGGTQILVTSSVLAPFLEERFSWRLSNRNSLALAPRVFYPVYSSDPTDGSGQLTSSWGGGLEIAWRHRLSKRTAFDLGMSGHILMLSLPQGQFVDETSYTLFTRIDLF